MDTDTEIERHTGEGPRDCEEAPGCGSSLRAGTAGTPLETLIRSLSLQVTQLQQVYSDWRQRLHRTVTPAVPVCVKEWGKREPERRREPQPGWAERAAWMRKAGGNG